MEHDINWWQQGRKGRFFDTFFAAAVSLADLGPCVAACCYRPANEPINGLYVPHA